MGIPAKDGAIAFALTCGAGMATTIGAAIVFFPKLVHYANNKVLAGSLSVAAGVMIYVSFVEIFFKSQGGFEDAGHSEARANLLATICFFGGICCGQLLNRLSHWVSGDVHDPESDHHSVDIDELKRMMERAEAEKAAEGPNAVKSALGSSSSSSSNSSGGGADADGANEQQGITLVKDGLSEKDFKRLKAQGKQGGDETSVAMVNMTAAVGGGAAAAAKSSHDPLDLEAASDDKEGGRPDKRLVKMGLQTALAIGIHNFPEGLATFVATLDDPVVGAGLAIAIAVHNVPEGLCVSVPIYYATRDRWEAFKWAFISGISEPIGAGLGWLVLYRTMDDNAYGVVFGLVAGMMINICISELLPTAFKYDPRDKIVTRCFVGGMAIMALSLVLFLNV